MEGGKEGKEENGRYKDQRSGMRGMNERGRDRIQKGRAFRQVSGGNCENLEATGPPEVIHNQNSRLGGAQWLRPISQHFGRLRREDYLIPGVR